MEISTTILLSLIFFWLLFGSGVDMVKNILKKRVTPLERKNRRLEALKRKTDKLEQNRLCLTDPEKSNAEELSTTFSAIS